MKKSILFYLGFIISMAYIVSCDKVENPIPDNLIVATPDSGIVWDDSNESIPNNDQRFVLLEEYTGHTCPNCPEGADTAKSIASRYSPRVVLVAIHAGFFAEFDPSDSKYFTNFKTEMGDELDNLFDPKSYPRGTINRLKFDDEWAIKLNLWEDKVTEVLGSSKPIANISIKNLYDDSTDIVRSQVIVEWTDQAVEGTEYDLQIVITEDKIIDWQKDLGDNIPDYEHNHVLRASINGLYGQKLIAPPAGGSVVADTLIQNFNPPANVIDIRNCNVVAFLFKPGPNDFEVMQVNEAHISSNN